MSLLFLIARRALGPQRLPDAPADAPVEPTRASAGGDAPEGPHACEPVPADEAPT